MVQYASGGILYKAGLLTVYFFFRMTHTAPTISKTTTIANTTTVAPAPPIKATGHGGPVLYLGEDFPIMRGSFATQRTHVV